jgi:hypothetical protein
MHGPMNVKLSELSLPVNIYHHLLFRKILTNVGVMCGDNIKIDLEVRECDVVGLIHVYQDKVQWRALVSAITKLP